MKRYGNLYHKIYDIKNIRLAHKNAKKGKLHYSEVRMVEANPEKYFIMIHNMLKNKTFCNSEYEVFTKKDKGKERKIFKLPYFPDRIIHHCIMNILEPIWIKTLITDTYSSLKNRGIHKGVKRLRKALKDRKNTKYCLKMDVHKFYPSINHSILKQTVRRKIKDKNVLWLLDHIIDSAEGVPVGNYLSQYFGNLYLSTFDHWLKEQKRCKYTFRYCDDVVILHLDKTYLSQLRKEISSYLDANLDLALKDNWQIFPVDKRGIDFLGYRFFHDYTLLRKTTAIRFKRRIQQIKRRYYILTPINILSGIMSYWGWMKCANCYRLSNRHIDDDTRKIVRNICTANKLHNPLRVY
ncbi:reverse transcriptase [Thermococci archaeon]|nr:MAG: reverse transcriptase [Thermococci archaeon]